MSTTKSKILQLGRSISTSNNYGLTAEAANGTMTMVNAYGDTNNDSNIFSIDSNHNIQMASKHSILDANGYAFNPVDGYRNKVINGNFDFWQRATSSTTQATSNNYTTADRWASTVNLPATVTGFTSSQQAFTLGQTEVPNNPKYFWRNQVTSYGTPTAATYWYLQTKLEDVTKYENKTMTLSFWAKSNISRNIAVEFVQSFGNSGSASSQAIGVTKLGVTTGWAKYTVTVDLPSISGRTVNTTTNVLNTDCLVINIWLMAGSNNGYRTDFLGVPSSASYVFDLAQVQFEEGPNASSFEIRPPGVEFNLCQRYYQTLPANFSFVTRCTSASGWNQAWFTRPVPLRGGYPLWTNNFAIDSTSSAITIFGTSTTPGACSVTSYPYTYVFVNGNNASGLTAGNTIVVRISSATSVSAEITSD